MNNTVSLKNVLASLSVAALACSAAAGTYSCSFSWFKNNPVGDFPVPVTLEEGALGFSYAGIAAGGADLRVSDGSANLPYEIENWNPAGKSVVWVKVPSFSSATVLTFKWGADAEGIAAAGTEGLWDDAFAVVHFGGGSVVNSVNGDMFAGEAASEVSVQGSGVHMAGSGNLLRTNEDIESYAATSNRFTISFWIKTDARKGGSNNDGTYLFQWGPTAEDGQHALLLNWNNDGVFSFYNFKNFTGNLPSDNRMKILDDAWHHFAFTYDGATFTCYRDGYAVCTSSLSGFSFVKPSTGGSYFSIGGTHGGAHLYRGSLDEVRFENVCRGADFIRASVETQSRDIPGGGASVSFADYTGAAIENFPVFVQIDANSGIVPESFHSSLLNGTARITDRRTGALLPIEVEHAFFNSFDNTIGFWTLMPRYSAADGVQFTTTFDCYKPSASEEGRNPLGPAGIWNADDYILVFHMNPTGLLHDVVHDIKLQANCRGTDNRLGGYPVATDGPTGPYGAYRSTTNAVQRNTGVTIAHPLTNVYTITWWMKQDADEYANPKKETYLWNLLGAQGLKGSGYSSNGTAANRIALYNGVKEAQIDVPDAGWHHYAYAVDGTRTYCYRDGELVKSTTQKLNFGCTSAISGKSVTLMSSSNPVKDAFRGCGDEIRLEAVCRSADWIKASYHNQLAWRDGTPWQLTPHFAKTVTATVADGKLVASAELSCRTNATVTIYWGTADAGRYPRYWEGSVPLGTKAHGTAQAQVTLPAAGRYVFRFCAENAFGKAWTEPRWVEAMPSGRPRVHEFAIAYAGAETLKDFPLCVRIPASVELPADKGKVRFTDADGKVLAWEAETWNPAGESVAWVRMPELAAGSVVRLEYRKNWEATDEWAAAEVWNPEDFTGVYHFAPASGVVTRDSSSVANDIVQDSLKAVATNGVAGSAFFWPGGNSGVTKGNDGGKEVCDFRNGFTFSGWIKRPADATATDQIFAKHELRSQTDIASGYYFQFWFCYSGGASGNVYLKLYSLNSMFTPYGLSFVAFGISDGGCNSGDTTAANPLKTVCSAACPDEDWHHYAFTHDGLFLRAYRDGVQVNRAFWPFIFNAGFPDHKLMSQGFGSNVNHYNCARGALDEYRSERTGRSAAWIKACYDNQRPGSDFVTLSRTSIPALKIIIR